MFKNSYTMKNFLKERKRKRDKEKSPLHPSYKEIETEIKEKDQKPPLSKEKKESGFEGLDDDQMGFWDECKEYIDKPYSEQTLKYERVPTGRFEECLHLHRDRERYLDFPPWEHRLCQS